jgi:hypothetical protein
MAFLSIGVAKPFAIGVPRLWPIANVGVENKSLQNPIGF